MPRWPSCSRFSRWGEGTFHVVGGFQMDSAKFLRGFSDGDMEAPENLTADEVCCHRAGLRRVILDWFSNVVHVAPSF